MELISHVDLVHGNESSTMISKTCRAVVRMGNGCMVIMMIQNPHIMSVAIFSRTPPPSGRFLFSAERRSPPSSQALVRKEKREAREGRRKREAWGVHCTPPPPSPGLRGPQACMDGRKGDRWTVKPSSVQPGYTLVDTLWVRLGGRGQYLQASWMVLGRHLSCM